MPEPNVLLADLEEKNRIIAERELDQCVDGELLTIGTIGGPAPALFHHISARGRVLLRRVYRDGVLGAITSWHPDDVHRAPVKADG
jgi:hypothetical protein